MTSGTFEALLMLEHFKMVSLSVVQSNETGRMVFEFLCNNISSTKLCKELHVAEIPGTFINPSLDEFPKGIKHVLSLRTCFVPMHPNVHKARA